MLREAGLEVGPGRVSDAIAASTHVDLAREEDVYWTLRTTLVARREELEPFDRAFARLVHAGAGAAAGAPRATTRAARAQGAQRTRRDVTPEPGASNEGEPDRIGWSAHEVLRHRDFAAMTPEELAAARRLIAQIACDAPAPALAPTAPAPPRPDARHARGWRATSLATGGDPVRRRFRRRTEAPRKLVALCDVSGSMEAYSRALLLFLHALLRSGRGVEVFAFGTRLTRLTDELATRDPEQALGARGRRASSTGRRAPGSAPRSRSSTTSGGGAR